MGLFKAKDLATDILEHFCRPTDHCFYCTEPLNTDEWIYWVGYGQQIWMHPACAKRLADHLNKDWADFKRLYPEKISI